MENKEVWIVVLIVGVLVLFNNGGFTGGYLVGDPTGINRQAYYERYTPPAYEPQQPTEIIRRYDAPQRPALTRELYNQPRGTGYSNVYGGYYVTNPAGAGIAPTYQQGEYVTTPEGAAYSRYTGQLRYPSEGVETIRPYVQSR